jgi:hypothetical protein
MFERNDPMRAWAMGIAVGDELTPDPRWNATEQRWRKLATPTIVLGVSREHGCQTGVMLTIRFASGQPGCLDAGWFYPGLDSPVFKDSAGYD